MFYDSDVLSPDLHINSSALVFCLSKAIHICWHSVEEPWLDSVEAWWKGLRRLAKPDCWDISWPSSAKSSCVGCGQNAGPKCPQSEDVGFDANVMLVLHMALGFVHSAKAKKLWQLIVIDFEDMVVRLHYPKLSKLIQSYPRVSKHPAANNFNFAMISLCTCQCTRSRFSWANMCSLWSVVSLWMQTCFSLIAIQADFSILLYRSSKPRRLKVCWYLCTRKLHSWALLLILLCSSNFRQVSPLQFIPVRHGSNSLWMIWKGPQKISDNYQTTGCHDKYIGELCAQHHRKSSTEYLQ